MNYDGNLAAKEANISFHFNDTTSSYESRLTLHNQSDNVLYFRVSFCTIKIVSTFGRLLSF